MCQALLPYNPESHYRAQALLTYPSLIGDNWHKYKETSDEMLVQTTRLNRSLGLHDTALFMIRDLDPIETTFHRPVEDRDRKEAFLQTMLERA